MLKEIFELCKQYPDLKISFEYQKFSDTLRVSAIKYLRYRCFQIEVFYSHSQLELSYNDGLLNDLKFYLDKLVNKQ